jgi:hypothetical protein
MSLSISASRSLILAISCGGLSFEGELGDEVESVDRR